MTLLVAAKAGHFLALQGMALLVCGCQGGGALVSGMSAAPTLVAGPSPPVVGWSSRAWGWRDVGAKGHQVVGYPHPPQWGHPGVAPWIPPPGAAFPR